MKKTIRNIFYLFLFYPLYSSAENWVVFSTDRGWSSYIDIDSIHKIGSDLSYTVKGSLYDATALFRTVANCERFEKFQVTRQQDYQDRPFRSAFKGTRGGDELTFACEYIYKANNQNDLTLSKASLEQERLRLVEERRKLDEEKRQREQTKSNQRITLQVNNSQPSAEGDVSINIQTNTDTASLKVNGEEQGGRADGKYTVKRVARAGQETRFEIIAKDVYGNSDTKTIFVSRAVVESKVTYQQLSLIHI